MKRYSPAFFFFVIFFFFSSVHLPSSKGQQISTQCTGLLLRSFTPCLNFLTGSTNGGASPSSECCKSLGSLISSSTQCACLVLTGSVPLSVPINRTLAISLPRLCKSTSVPLQCSPGLFIRSSLFFLFLVNFCRFYILMEQEKSRSPTKLSKLLCQLRLKITYYSIKESVLAILLIVMIIRFVPRRASAQSSDCSSTIISLAPCLNYITGSSDTPDVPCCTQLAKVVQSAPKCLCLILDGGASQFGVTLNATKALALPGACNVQTPPVSRCKDVSSPAPAPGSGSDSAPGKTSRGSFLQPVALPILFSVIFIILAGFSMHYISF